MSGSIKEEDDHIELDVTPLCGLRGYCVLNVQCPHRKKLVARSKLVMSENMIRKCKIEVALLSPGTLARPCEPNRFSNAIFFPLSSYPSTIRASWLRQQRPHHPMERL